MLGKEDGEEAREAMLQNFSNSYVRLLLTKPTRKPTSVTRREKLGWNHQMILWKNLKQSVYQPGLLFLLGNSF